jgi:hypothetical protein
MAKIFEMLSGILAKVSMRYLVMAMLFVAVPSMIYVTAMSGGISKDKFVGRLSVQGDGLYNMDEKSLASVRGFMAKYHSNAVYLTVLRFDFQKNSRVPFHREFNDDDVKKVVMDRLAGGDGALPLFIQDDTSNNNQMIHIIQGDNDCSDWTAGGLARVWPDLKTTFTFSCRVPIPPTFGGTRGYIVVHFKGPRPRDYEMETIKLDLMKSAIIIDEANKKSKSVFK